MRLPRWWFACGLLLGLLVLCGLALTPDWRLRAQSNFMLRVSGQVSVSICNQSEQAAGPSRAGLVCVSRPPAGWTIAVVDPYQVRQIQPAGDLGPFKQGALPSLDPASLKPCGSAAIDDQGNFTVEAQAASGGCASYRDDQYGIVLIDRSGLSAFLLTVLCTYVYPNDPTTWGQDFPNQSLKADLYALNTPGQPGPTATPLSGGVSVTATPVPTPLSGGVSATPAPSPGQPPMDGGVDEGPPPTGSEPWPPEFQPIQPGTPPAPCYPAQADRIGSWEQTGPCPAPPDPATRCGGVTSIALIPVLARLCVAVSLYVPVTGCIDAYRAQSTSQAAGIISLLDSPAPPYWVWVLTPASGELTAPGSKTIPRQPPNDQNGTGTDAKFYYGSDGNYEDGLARDPCATLIHELEDAVQINDGTNDNSIARAPGARLIGGSITPVPGLVAPLPRRELAGVTVENCWRSLNALPLRRYYYTNSGAFAILPSSVLNPPASTCFPQLPQSRMLPYATGT